MFYKGVSRSYAVCSLICHLRKEKPDIVGLSECFDNEEREQIRTELQDIYHDYYEGPDLPVAWQDGGLLLLSKHPIVERHSTIYRQCKGEDCYAFKGVLHARILVKGHPVLYEYDVFLSHMQSCPPMTEEFKEWIYNLGIPIISTPFGLGKDCLEKLQLYQVLHLCSFVHAYSSPYRPALLMGDLNHNGRDEAIRKTLVKRLGHPEDLWLTTGTGYMNGITRDAKSSFSDEAPPRVADDPERGKEGERLDYFFSWRKFELMRPTYTNTRVIVWQSVPGRDISDHYGLITQQTELCEVDIDVTQKIKNVTVSLKAFHCLVETAGSVPLFREWDSDEVEFELSVHPLPVIGEPKKLKTELIEDVVAGTYHEFNPPHTLIFNDPGNGLNIYVTGWEVDTALGIGETGRVTLGPIKIFVDRQELLFHKNRPMWRTPPLLKGDEGEYAVILEIKTTV